MNQYHWDLDDPFMQNYFIAHHGVKGQSWGKRQWQNPDGSLTPAGRIHYGIGKAREAIETAGTNIKTAFSEKIKEMKYGKTYDSDVIGNVSTKFGKTQYTNLDGTLNEKGKKLASEFTTKEIEKNNKYYDKKIEHYKKAAEAYKDQPDIAKKFAQMAKSAEESRDRTNENLKNLSLDQMLTIQMQRNQKAAKIAAGAAGVVGAGTLIAAATNENVDKVVNDVFNSFGPDTPMDVVNQVMDTKVGKKAFEMVDTSIRTYADARAYVVGTVLDQSMNRLNQMGVPQKAGQMVGTAASEAANSLAESGVAESYARVGSQFVNTFMSESATGMNNFTDSANRMLDTVDRSNKTATDLANAINSVSTASSQQSSNLSKILNSDINSVANTVVNNSDIIAKAINSNITGTQKQASASTQDYVESLRAAGHTLAEIERETGLSRQLLNSIL